MSGGLPTLLRSRNGLRPVLLGLAVLRGVLAVVAIPLAPALWDDHLAVLVLLRPTKEVFLLAGYEVLEGRLALGIVALAAIPLLLLAVWVSYVLGRSYADDLDDADLPGIAGQVLPRERIHSLRDAVADRGWPLVFVGWLAMIPSTLIAAAAGAAGVPARTFLLADAAGAVVSTAAMLTAGFLLGEAYESAGPWFTGLAVVAVLGVLTLLGRRLSDGGRTRAAPAAASTA